MILMVGSIRCFRQFNRITKQFELMPFKVTRLYWYKGVIKSYEFRPATHTIFCKCGVVRFTVWPSEVKGLSHGGTI